MVAVIGPPAIYSLVGSAKHDGLDPETNPRFVIERIADYRISELDNLLPRNVATQIAKTTGIAAV